MSQRISFLVLALLVLSAVAAMSPAGGVGPSRAVAQDPANVWLSAMVWSPTLEESGLALADVVNQIDATCNVDVDSIGSTGGAGPDGAVYAFAINWNCPASASQQGLDSWYSTMLWRPTLSEAGQALAEIVNQIDGSCIVDVEPVASTNGAGPEGSVYAFAVTWGCPPGSPQQGVDSWYSTMLWRPTLAEAGNALAEIVNQIDAACTVDVAPVSATNGVGQEGIVIAFAISWTCVSGTGTAAVEQTPDQLTMSVFEFGFDPAQLTVVAMSETSVLMTNEGVAAHNFTIDALGIAIDLQPGESKQATLNAAPGNYAFYCSVPGHRDFGMEGNLTVL